MILAQPGDTIEFGPGRFEFTATLSLDVSGVTIRGQGSDQTTLSFARQRQGTGSEGILVTSKEDVLVEDLAVEDAKGDAIKVNGCRGITLRRLRVGWSGGPKDTNGAYGLYPVLCQDVLVEDCVVRESSDAGIYVGQSENIIVRRNLAERNVAGIEIENSQSADVFENKLTDNAGGILIFSLPNLERKDGSRCRVLKNQVVANNHENFAAKGNIVAEVPSGTGIMLLASSQVEVFDNTIEDNETVGLAICSYQVTQRPFDDPLFYPYCEAVYVHDNKFQGGGNRPHGTLGLLIASLMGGKLPNIVFDGVSNPSKTKDGALPEDLTLRIADNGEATFANFNFEKLGVGGLLGFGRNNVSNDLTPYTGRHENLPPVVIEPARLETVDKATDTGFPEDLADYHLFEGNGSTQVPLPGVIPYDINTPLFSDYSEKYRFVKLPPGGKIEYRDRDTFEFPVGTVIAKTFAYPNDARDPARGRRLLETRIIKREPDGWIGLPYVWNAEQTKATLDVAGAFVDVHWIDAEGREQTNDYIVPNMNQCKGCHKRDGTFQPIGPTARQLNRDFEYPKGKENQLAYWTQVGVLVGCPTPRDTPKLAVWNDPATGSLDERARAWLEINCAHCHNPAGPARNSGLDLTASQLTPAKYGIFKTPVAAGRGSGGMSFDIVPGDPDHSIVVHRLHSSEAGVMMPELGKRLTHDEGVKLVHDWIASLPRSRPPSSGH